MAFPPEDRALLKESIGRFVAETVSLEKRRMLLDADQAVDRDNWRALADMGVLGLPFLEADGGLGGCLADVMAVARELGHGLALEPYAPCVVVAGRLLATAGSLSQRREWLAPLIAGEKLLALAHAERDFGCTGHSKVLETVGGWQLVGAKLLVPLARDLDAMLVTARDMSGALRICLVPTGAEGVSVRSYRTVDGQVAGEVNFERVVLGPEGLLPPSGPALEMQLAGVMNYARATLAADMVGSMSALLAMTIDYGNTRKRFGQPIARFQALKHRLVDCYTCLVQSEAMLDLVAIESAHDWAGNVASAKAFIDQIALDLGHEAIQMHGGMGLTDDLAVSHHHKRIVANTLVLGDARSGLRLIETDRANLKPASRSDALPFEQLLTGPEQRFRGEVQSFLRNALTPELRTVARHLTTPYPERNSVIEWQQTLNAKGWLAPLWPKEQGGTGWSAVERFIFEYSCAIAGAPERVPMGIRYVGPIIAEFGSEWQKQYFLPKMLASEHYWAQGFSEPGAGSDLAAIKTTANLDGDHFVVNGNKCWTTHAHWANWIFCLVRTSASEKLQDGISFLLIDLKSDGIHVDPIRLMTNDPEVNQVFFKDVRVPVRNLIGEAGKGWRYAKYLLELERGGSAFCGRARFEFDAVKELLSLGATPSSVDPAVALEVVRLEHRLMALELLEFRQARAMPCATDPGVGGSVAKLLSSELQKDITELGMRIAGTAGLEFEERRPMPVPRASGYPGSDLELVAMPRYLNSRVFSIFGGSSEIQREIIAKQILRVR